MGPAFLWDWQTDEYEEIAGGVTLNCHDVQWSHADAGGPAGGGTIWTPSISGKGFALVSAATGELLSHYEVPAAGDVNHVQLVHDDAIAYVSSRLTNAIYKVDVAAGGTTVWVCGGEHGEFELVDAGGTRYPKGYSLWHGQHNAEYFGEYVNAAGALVHQVMMFDNQYEQGASSRMLVVEIDEAALVATVVWEWSVGAYTKVYGDNDRLPSGNLLGSFWVTDFDVAEWNDHEYGDEQFDARVVEVVRDTQLPAARELQGELPLRARQPLSGGGVWYIYSVERFYPTPFVHSPRARARVAGRQRVQAAELLRLLRGEGHVADVMDGEFGFKAHWTPANVTVAVPSSTGDRDA